MLVCEDGLVKATHRFLREAKIPQLVGVPPGGALELVYVTRRILPAFLAALEEVEAVDLCSGFDLERLIREQEAEAEIRGIA